MPIEATEILQMQREGVLDGQLRIGTSKPGRNGGKSAVRLNTWRFTSPSRRAVEAAAEKFKGSVERWDSDRGAQWQVITPLSEIAVHFGGGAAVDQWMTHWEKGILQRHCTGGEGAVNSVSKRPCECNLAGQRLCKPETKLRVRFPDLPGIGWWRFTSHGKHVAGEFHEKAKLLLEAAEQGIYVPAFLILREMKLPPKNPGEPGRRFPVVNIDIPVSIEDIALGRGGVGTLPQIMQARREALALTAGPRVTVTALPAASSDATVQAPTVPASVGVAPTPTQQQSAPQDPAKKAHAAAEWLRQSNPTRQRIADFLEGNAGDPAMDEYLEVGEGEPETTLRDLIADRLDELAKGEEAQEGDGGTYFDPELGVNVPIGAGVHPSEYASETP